MSDSETTQVWDEGEELDNAEMETDFSSALSSLGAHLQEQELADDDAPAGYDDSALAEEQALLDTDYPAYEDVSHDAAIASELDALDAALAEEDDFSSAHYDAAPAVYADDELALADSAPADPVYEELPADEAPEAFAFEAQAEDAPVEAVAFVQEHAPAETPAPEAPAADMTGAEHFNLTTLTGLIDEIRAESDRVHQMKESVSKALSLIQEMAESLKS
jgi:hypothetical protein